MKRILASLLAFALAFNPLLVGATTYFFSDCYAGAAAGCVPGANSYNGLSRYPGKLDDGVTVNSAYGPKQNWLGFDFGTKAAGDHFSTAQGASMNLYLTQSAASSSVFAAGSPCVVNWTGHGFVAGTELNFVTTGAFPTGTGISGTTVGGIVKAVLSANTFSFAYGPQSGAFSCSDSGTGTVTITTKSPTVVNTNATKANPIVWDSYNPPNFTGGGAKPIINVAGTQDCIDFSQGGTSAADGGYTVKDLKLQTIGGFAVGNNNKCFFVYQEANDITLDNLDISGFSIALYVAGFATCCTSGDGISKRVTLKNSNIHDNGDMGVLQGSDDILIENNVFDNNGFGGGSGLSKNHHIYLNGGGVDTNKRAVVRNNRLTRNSVCQAGTDLAHAGSRCTSSADYGTCQGSVIVVHGIMSQLVLENNDIDETPGAIDACYGVDISPGYATAPIAGDANESFTDIVARGNKLSNVGSNGITCTSCIRPTIESNMISWTVSNRGYGVVGIAHGTGANYGGGGSVDAVDTASNTRNNSIYIDVNSVGNVGIQVKSQVPASTSGIKVNNNAIIFGSNAPTTSKCFDWTGLTMGTQISSWDYNLCYRPTADATWSQAAANLAAAQALSPAFDTHSKSTTPNLTAAPSSGNGWLIQFSGGSNTEAAGLASNCPKLGYRSKVYTGVCQMGAIQATGSAVAPGSVIHTVIQ